jgi:hypothetical protein
MDSTDCISNYNSSTMVVRTPCFGGVRSLDLGHFLFVTTLNPEVRPWRTLVKCLKHKPHPRGKDRMTKSATVTALSPTISGPTTSPSKHMNSGWFRRRGMNTQPNFSAKGLSPFFLPGPATLRNSSLRLAEHAAELIACEPQSRNRH